MCEPYVCVYFKSYRGYDVMKFFKDLFRHTLIYKVYSTLYWLKEYISDYSYVSDSLHSEAFSLILRRYLNCEFRTDWIGRLYGVINPHINIDGKFNFSNTIIEIDGANTNSHAFVENWLYRQMSLVKNVYNLDNSGFFDYIGVDIKHVGPKSHDNYLVIFDIVSRKEFSMYLKRAFKHSILYITIVLGILIYLNFR